MITEAQLKDCKKEFEEYFKSLTAETHENKTRIDDVRSHSLRVAANTKTLTSKLLQSEEDQALAEVIALFHDLGRAAMISEGTESPTNIHRNHAGYSLTIMAGMSCWTSLTDEAKLTIQKAIDGHNKNKLPKLDSEQQMLYARILRDADKLDIFDSSYRFFKERAGIQPIVTFDLINSAEVSDKILKSIQGGKPALLEDMKTMNDYKLLLMSMVFDLNFKYTFRIMAEKQYIQKIYETLPKRDHIIDAYRGIKLFVENKFVFSGN